MEHSTIDEYLLQFETAQHFVRETRKRLRFTTENAWRLTSLEEALAVEREFAIEHAAQQRKIRGLLETVKHKVTRGELIVDYSISSPTNPETFDWCVKDALNHIYTVREHANVLSFILTQIQLGEPENIQLAEVSVKAS